MSDEHQARGCVAGPAGFAKSVEGHANSLGIRLIATVTTARDGGWWGGDRVIEERVRYVARGEDPAKLADFLHLIGAR